MSVCVFISSSFCNKLLLRADELAELTQLTGIAALLRFPLPDLEDIEM